MQRQIGLGIVLGFFLPLPAIAATLEDSPKDTLQLATLPVGHSQWSLLAASRIGIKPGVELTTNVASWLLATPNVGLRALMLQSPRLGQLHVSLHVGLPTFAMQLSRGYLLPTNLRSDDAPIWTVVPTASLVWDRRFGRLHQASQLDLAYGVAFSETTPAALDTLAPIELALAPVTRTFRVGLQKIAAYDLSPRLAALASAAVFLTGKSASGTSGTFLRARLGLSAKITSNWSMSLQTTWYNYDQGAISIEHDSNGFARTRRVRSNDFWPTFDITWRPSPRRFANNSN